jgi:hypothetical protein
MDEQERQKQELELELQWVKYRLKMLDTIEDKLQQMKQLAILVQQDNLSELEKKELNNRFNKLANQVNELDTESMKVTIWKNKD